MAQLEFLYQPVTLGSGDTETSEISIAGCTLVGFRFPASFEGTSLTLKGCGKGGEEPFVVKDPTTGNAVIIVVSGQSTVPLPATDLSVLQHFKIVSNVAPAADRIITVIARPVA